MRGMRFERVALLLVLVAVVPLLMGAGGGNPGVPLGTKVAGTTYVASVVVDPHEGGATTTARQASIRIYRDPHTAAAIFEIPALGFPFQLGCDLTKTNARFLNVPLTAWIPEDVVDELFAALGDPRTLKHEPVITRIQTAACTPDVANPTPVDHSRAGILSFEATIRFLVPR